jgi:hypothetical protein
MDSREIKYFHYCRKSSWVVPLSKMATPSGIMSSQGFWSKSSLNIELLGFWQTSPLWQFHPLVYMHSQWKLNILQHSKVWCIICDVWWEDVPEKMSTRIKKSLSDFVSYFCFIHNLFTKHLQTTLYELRYGQTLRIYWHMEKVLGC